MDDPTPFGIRQADVARKAAAKGHMLVTHLHFSLNKDGSEVLPPVESLDNIDAYLDRLPR